MSQKVEVTQPEVVNKTEKESKPSSMSKIKEFKEFKPRMNANASEYSPVKKAQNSRRGGNATKRTIPPSPAVTVQKSEVETKTNKAEQEPSKGTTQRNRKRHAKPQQSSGKEQERNEKAAKSPMVKQNKPRQKGANTSPQGPELKPPTVAYPTPDHSHATQGGRRGRGSYHFRRRKESDAMSVASTTSTVSTVSTVSTSDLPLRDRLERDLVRQKYRCAICMDFVRKTNKIWSCPDCFVVLHMNCMKEWMFNNLDAATKDTLPKQARDVTSPKFLGYLHTHDVLHVLTRCPQCRAELQVPTILSGCFCGNGIINPKEAEMQALPHSCGKICGRSRGEFCTHPCSDICHPGPCHPCSATIQLSCRCGKTQQMVRCGTDPSTVQCENVCGKLLDCKEHTCSLVCHAGPCPSCEIPVECSCYCGAQHSIIPCGMTKMAMRSRNPPVESVKAPVAADPTVYNEDVLGDLSGLSDLSDDEPVETASFKMLSYREAGVGGFSCGEVCGRLLSCGRHRCERICHPLDCGLCPYQVTDTSLCPCGKHLAKELDPNWTSCADPYPTCGEECGKKLPCGHTCPLPCHTGSCPPCSAMVTQKCRCTFSERQVPCWVLSEGPGPADLTEEEIAKRREPFICTRPCKTDMNCGRHKCMELCCPHKGQKSDGTFHVCTQTCDKVLNCGKHHCYLPCHPGPCVPCQHILSTPITCACGKTVIKPPVVCGTPPPVCNMPCSKPCPRGHLNPNHACHFGPCPPCPVITERMCEGGHGIVKGVPCYREKVFCNRVCGKLLPCGHVCQRTCHDGPCITEEQALHGCGQPCGKKREFCEHTCQAPCHPGQSCPSVPCMFDVVVHCPCGRRSETQKCLIGVSGDPNVLQDLSQRSLECDSECRIIQRNRKLAEALNVGPASLNLPESETMRAYEAELQNCPYAKSTLYCASMNPELVTWLQTACEAICSSSKPQAIQIPQQYACFHVAIADVAKEYGITVEKRGSYCLVPGEVSKRPALFLKEALSRFQSLIDGKRLHAAQPLAKYATERDFCSLFIHNRHGQCVTDRGLLEYLTPYLPADQYKIRSWLRPDGLLVLLKTEEMARRVKMDLEMRDPEFDVDFWAVRDDGTEKKTDGAESSAEQSETKTENVMKVEEEKLENENSFALLEEDS